MKSSLLIFLLFSSFWAIAQPSTEVYLFDFSETGEQYEIKNPKNISSNEGYDNQPSFSSDGRYLYYTSWQNDNQTDIIQFDLQSGTKQKVSSSDGSEYSPTEMPKGKSVSTIILERDGQQLLWQYDLKNGERSLLVPELVVGYHCWYDKKTIFSFILGAPPTLQQINVKTGESIIIDEKIGRSIHRIPNEKSISYISKAKEAWEIIRYDIKSNTKSKIANTLKGSEDLCWAPTGNVIMGSGNQLYVLGPNQKWELIADFSNFGLAGITRLAMNAAGDKLAVVVNE